MNVLVTGGAGFIGSHLVDRLLNDGHHVIVVDDLSTGSLANLDQARQIGVHKLEFENMDVTTDDFIKLVQIKKPEVIFHLAAQSSVASSQIDPINDAKTNVLGTLNVLESARKNGVKKVIYAASGGTLYGELRVNELPAKESRAFNPASFYGASKKIGIDYMFLYRNYFDLEFVALALANVYGPRQDPKGEAGVIAIFSDALLNGAPCIIHGDGKQTRDFVFVIDVVDAFIRASEERGNGLVINVSTAKRTSVNEVYNIMCECAGIKPEPKFGPKRPGDIKHSALDNTRAKIQLGWEPWTPLEEGISETLKFFAQKMTV
jgi:UDP-glucose 4-epimerase